MKLFREESPLASSVALTEPLHRPADQILSRNSSSLPYFFNPLRCRRPPCPAMDPPPPPALMDELVKEFHLRVLPRTPRTSSLWRWCRLVSGPQLPLPAMNARSQRLPRPRVGAQPDGVLDQTEFLMLDYVPWMAHCPYGS